MLRDLSFRSILTPVGGILKRDRAASGPATLHATLQLGLIRQADQEWFSSSKLTILLGCCIRSASAAVVLSHKMSIRFDRLTAYVHDDVSKTAMQAATFTAILFGLKPLGVALVFYI
jgi:hypothetical protein